MRWATALTTDADSTAAIDAALAELDRRLCHEPAHLVLVFASPDFDAHLAELSDRVHAAWPDACLLGCTAAGVIGAAQEHERGPCLTVVGAHMPGVLIEPFHLLHRQLPAADADAATWRAALGLPADDAAVRHAIVLPDPFSMDVPRLIGGLEQISPDGVILGGSASGGQSPGAHRLIVQDRLYRAGVAGVLLSGNVVVDTVISQGCRPVGAPCFVTRCRGNVIAELDGQPALQALQAMVATLDPADVALCQQALFVGLVMDPGRQAYGSGDFLIRHLIGIDSASGALVVGARPALNAVVQFHVRDAAASSADLARLLRRARSGGPRAPAGGLLFDCLGRGEQFFGVRAHDTRMIGAEFGDLPIGGFFCSGEIGPIDGRAWLHGYTAALGLFRPRLDS